MLSNRKFYLIFLILAGVMTVLNFTIAQRDPALFDPLIDISWLVHNRYVTAVDDKAIVKGAIDGLLGSLDPYSEYIPPDELEEFNRRTSGVYEGIGIGIDIKDGYVTVIAPFEGSPAYKAGVLPGDIIMEVNGKSTKGWTATRAINEMTGPAGTKVTIQILHADGGAKTLELTRDKVHMPSVRGWRIDPASGQPDYLLEGESGIGYIRITQFIDNTVTDFDQAFETLRQSNLKALIIDLRGNPGGLMSEAVAMVDRFVDAGVIVSTKGANSREVTLEAKAEGTYPRYPLVALVDQGSASASEIVSGSLQDHGRAVVVGERTWGKGSVQQIIRLSDSGATVKLTTDHYYLPKGRCVHKLPGAAEWGVTPDVQEPLPEENLTELRKLLTELYRGGNGQTRDKANETAPDDATAPAPPESPARPAKENAADQDSPSRPDPAFQILKLLELDNQLAQAVKQCKGLLRSQPDMTPLGESASVNTVETGSKP